MIRNIVKMTTMVAMDKMIMRVKMDGKMTWWWPYVCVCE
jgi:hypothetical protein